MRIYYRDTEKYAYMYLMKRGFIPNEEEIAVVSDLILDYMIDRGVAGEVEEE